MLSPKTHYLKFSWILFLAISGDLRLARYLAVYVGQPTLEPLSPVLRGRSRQTSLAGSFYRAGYLGNPKDLVLLEIENLCDIANLYVCDNT